MYISKAAAQEIVEEIGEEIQESINMMDEEGVIVASTDLSRIGHLHEGARQIITEGLDELYISESMETETTKRGINLALKIDGVIVGAVGITGERERVIGYGNIVRHMTEIMIVDTMQKNEKRYGQMVHYRFIEEWIFQSRAPYPADFIKRGKYLGIDVQKPYRVMMILFQDYEELSLHIEGQQLLEEMEATIRHEMDRCDYPYLNRLQQQVCMVLYCSNEVLIKLAHRLSDMILQKYCRKISIGFDSGAGDKMDIRQKYMEADRAASHALSYGMEWFLYDSANLELLLNEVSDQMMADYLKNLFPGTKEKEVDEFMMLTNHYFMYDGSITKMAEGLYMHKNTLQYKIKKMAELTGKDIRKPSDAAVYQVALAAYHRILQNKGE